MIYQQTTKKLILGLVLSVHMMKFPVDWGWLMLLESVDRFFTGFVASCRPQHVECGAKSFPSQEVKYVPTRCAENVCAKAKGLYQKVIDHQPLRTLGLQFPSVQTTGMARELFL